MKVSILIPIYNVERYIERCAVSLFKQSYEDIEFIFVNDNTQDNSIKVLNKVIAQFPIRQSQITIINHDKNQGISHTRNTALINATGDYVYIIDSDDFLLHDNVIQKFVSTAVLTGADIVEAKHKKIKLFTSEDSGVPRKYGPKNKLVHDVICKKSQITVWNKLIRRDLFNRQNIYFPDDINNGEDYVTLPKLFYFSNKVTLLNEYTYGYNLCNLSAFSSNKKSWINLDSMIAANRHLLSYFNNLTSEFSHDIERMYLETKAYHLLYSIDNNELNLTRNKFNNCKYKYFFYARWKYQIIMIFDFLRLNRLLLFIGEKYFRK